MPELKPRLFLDTNVIFSGLDAPEGAPGRILEAFVEGRLAVVVSARVLDEVIRVVGRKVPAALGTLQTLLVSCPPEVVPEADPGWVRGWAKLPAADAAILAAAGEAGVDGLVSGDRHFLDLTAAAGKAGLLILTPAACAARYLEPASGI